MKKKSTKQGIENPQWKEGRMGVFSYLYKEELTFLSSKPQQDRYTFYAGVIGGTGGMHQRLQTCHKALEINHSPTGLTGEEYINGSRIKSEVFHIEDCSVLLEQNFIGRKNEQDYDILSIIGMDESKREATLRTLEEAFR